MTTDQRRGAIGVVVHGAVILALTFDAACKRRVEEPQGSASVGSASKAPAAGN